MKLPKSISLLCIAGAAFFALAASSPECARTHDSVTGPITTLDAADNECVSLCIELFQESMRSEHARFKAAIAACDGNEECQEAEEELHESIIGELQNDKGDCLLNCNHNQGEGSSGQ